MSKTRLKDRIDYCNKRILDAEFEVKAYLNKGYYSGTIDTNKMSANNELLLRIAYGDALYYQLVRNWLIEHRLEPTPSQKRHMIRKASMEVGLDKGLKNAKRDAMAIRNDADKEVKEVDTPTKNVPKIKVTRGAFVVTNKSG